MKVLILTPAPPDISPGQRFRFEHYIKLSNHPEIIFVTKSFFSKKVWAILHLNGHVTEKVFGIISGFIKRFLILFTLPVYDFVYIYREATVIGPPVIEWIIAKIFTKKIIYDFDDAIWISNSSEANPKAAMIKCTWKVKFICKWSYRVSAGNPFLAGYAKQFCKNVTIIPTVVNTNQKHNQVKNQELLPVTIGWTGTFTNFVYLNKIIPVLKKLQVQFGISVLIIADKDPLYNQIQYVFKPWNIDTEIEDLLMMNIGVMPLENSPLELGKCAFKAIQYMSLGIPAVVSAVGANKEVVLDGENGYWASTEDEWYNKLSFLINNGEARSTMGKNARGRIISNYSVISSESIFFELFKKTL